MMNRRDFLKSAGAVAAVAALPAVATTGYVEPWIHGGAVWCGPVYFRDRFFFVSSPSQVMEFSEIQDPNKWL